MEMLPSQLEALLTTLEARGYRQHQFELQVQQNLGHVVRCEANSNYFFAIKVLGPLSFGLKFVPGPSIFFQEAHVTHWAEVIGEAAGWADRVTAQLRVLARQSDGDSPPDWLETGLPSPYANLKNQLKTLQRQVDSIEAAGRLLWQTGRALEEAVLSVLQQAA